MQSSRKANSYCYYWKCHPHDLNRRELKLGWTKLRKTIIYFQYHLNCQYIHDKNGDIEVDLVQSSRKANSYCYYWKCHQHDLTRRYFKLGCIKLRKAIIYFHYHLNCQYIHDKNGDIEVYLVQSSRKANSYCYYWKCHQHDLNRRELKLGWRKLRKTIIYFQYHLNCQYIHDKNGDIEVDLVQSSRKVNSHYCYWKCHQHGHNRRDLNLGWIKVRKTIIYFQWHPNCQYIHDKNGAIEVDLLQSSRNANSHCYYWKCHQHDLNRRDLKFGWIELRKTIIHFQYHLNCQYIHDKNGDIEVDLVQSSRKANSHYYYWKCHQHDLNRRDFELGWIKLRKTIIYFQYHLNCQYINDKNGDIEVDLVQSSRKVNSHYCYWKCHQHGHNRRDLNLVWTKLIKKMIYFQYHLNCQYIHDKNGDIEDDLVQSSRKVNSHYYYWKCHQHGHNRRDLNLDWTKWKQKIIYFQYHLNCQRIHGKNGAIEVDLLQSSRNANSNCCYWKCHQHDHNRWYLKLGWIK